MSQRRRETSPKGARSARGESAHDDRPHLLKVATVAAGVAAATAAGVVAVRALRGRGGPHRHNAGRSDAERTVYHVLPADGGWQVNVEDRSAPVSRHPTKREALASARDVVHDHEPSELVIHAADGTVQKSHRYGDESRGT